MCILDSWVSISLTLKQPKRESNQSSVCEGELMLRNVKVLGIAGG